MLGIKQSVMDVHLST